MGFSQELHLGLEEIKDGECLKKNIRKEVSDPNLICGSWREEKQRPSYTDPLKQTHVQH